MNDKRAFVQATGHQIHPVDRKNRVAAGEPGLVPGTVAWSEHLEAWNEYARRGHGSQSAERVHERAGFCYAELTDLLGHAPTTWKPR